MSDVQTMVRTQVVLNGERFLLAQGQDLNALKQRIELAAATGGKFVDFVVVGNREVSVLVSPGVPVVFSVETVQYDVRDTGVSEEPFGGLFDF
jgi:hypothetical protein